MDRPKELSDFTKLLDVSLVHIMRNAYLQIETSLGSTITATNLLPVYLLIQQQPLEQNHHYDSHFSKF